MKPRYRPMLAKSASEPFSSRDWIFEIKWDGFRVIAYVNEELSLKSRNQKELKRVFPELEELKHIANNVVLDGEIVATKDGKPDFQALLERANISTNEIALATNKVSIVYVIFDILEKEGRSLERVPLIERKKILADSIEEGNHVLISDFVEEKGEAYYSLVLGKGLEGIIAKKKDSYYESGVRSNNWLKIKPLRHCDCVILGYTKGSGLRKTSFGALILGLYDINGKLVYVGKVGIGFSKIDLKALSKSFAKIAVKASPIEVEIAEEVTWLRPILVCEVLYQTITKDIKLRMPRFRGLRTDKEPKECTLSQILQSNLSEYVSKRDFRKTPEPTGGEKKIKDGIFVVQEHHARKLHYDLRLENQGVLKSWAVPKGIPVEINRKRLAVQTEDHPIGYADFEGTIPKGQYGAGTVKIWDKGTYKTKIWENQKIEFDLYGEKLKGRYILVYLKKSGEKNWLLFKGRE